MTTSIAWLTPFSRASDVSAFSRNLLIEFEAVAPHLGASVSILINENGPSYWSALPKISLTGSDVDAEIVSSFDYCIYNLGNNQENHHYINSLAMKIPGIVIVHDLVMQHYLAWHFFENKKRSDLYGLAMAEYYGMAGVDLVAASGICETTMDPVYAPWDSLHVSSFPLIEPFIQSAAAVVVHSRFAEDIVRTMTTAPILRLQLPWDQKSSLTPADQKRWQTKTRSSSISTILCFGHIGRAKCLDLVIDAFARSTQLQEHSNLIIAGYPGDVQYVEELQRSVAAYGLSRWVSFELAVSDDRLLKLKKDADVFVNLRYPNTEGASGSLIEQLNTGKPVVVYPTGAFKEIDKGAIVTVEREQGVPAIVSTLEALTLDANHRIETGQRGLKWVRRVGRKEYIAGLWAFINNHQQLLTERKRYAVERRMQLPSSSQQHLTDSWLEGVVRGRRIFEFAASERPTLDARFFLNASPKVLARYIAVAVFGQSKQGATEQTALKLIQTYPIHDVYFGVATASAIFRYLRDDARAPGTSRWHTAPLTDVIAWQIIASLPVEIFVLGCYELLLGRRPWDGEVPACINGVRLKSKTEVFCEFVESEEFRGRIPGDFELNQFTAWARTTADWADLPLLPANRTIHLCSADADHLCLLAKGWHAPEEEGVWSGSVAGVLGFRHDSRAGQRLTFRARLAELPGATGNVLTVKRNGKVIGSFTSTNGDWFVSSVELFPEETGLAPHWIEFECSTLVNFASIGAHSDTRDLGVMLSELAIN